MMIDRHTLTPIGILAVHFGSHDIAAAGDAVQKLCLANCNFRKPQGMSQCYIHRCKLFISKALSILANVNLWMSA